ncbi:MAG: hypothetical protein NC122_01100 [Faecalibacterium sp.]|nr:hypothetical protein [Ruminococcus sp.]MCM1391241.1 hypothetical protein [Ruminococcus sp.]MCM1484785.1 hypothetical protein [Faecalibacterium sp.]
MNSIEILKELSVINKDDGNRFKCANRLDRVAQLLWNSKYKRINADGLFHLYSEKPIQELSDKLWIVSCHVDCASSMTKCFTEEIDEEMLRGTFDNQITCAAIVYLMLESVFPPDVVIAFTGDEEENSRGAADLIQFLNRYNKQFSVVVLDVTDMGWTQNACFTVENNFWSDKIGKAVIDAVIKKGAEWIFVPSDVDDIPMYIPNKNVILEEAEPDESWEYDENDIECFSLCLPVNGDMHSNDGVVTYVKYYYEYIDMLEFLLNTLPSI